jgi:hypothetical protein
MAGSFKKIEWKFCKFISTLGKWKTKWLFHAILVLALHKMYQDAS